MAPTDRNNCKKCNKNINLRTQKHIFCEGVCRNVWHAPKCGGVSEVNYEEILKNSDIPWFCEPCKTQRRQRRIMMNEAISATAQITQMTPASQAQTPAR